MKKAAVIGFPINHSLSPILHNFLLKKYQIEGSYEAISIEPTQLENQLDELLFTQNYQGLNVTIPFKEQIFKIFQERDYKITQKANSIGAINTIYKENNQIIGSNSDIYGFEKNLLSNSHGKLKTDSALIIGAGGAAAATLYSLSTIFSTIYIVNRTPQKAINLAKTIKNSLKNHQNTAKIEIIDKLSPKIAENLNLVVNTTSIGMKSNNFEHFIDINHINNDCFIYDLVYNPLHTDLLIKAKNAGKPIITGIGMLIYQAFEGFEKWFGIKPDLTKEEFEELTKELILHIK